MKTLSIIFAIFAMSNIAMAQKPIMIIHCNQACSKPAKDKKWDLTYKYADASFLVFTDSTNTIDKIEATFGPNNEYHTTFYVHDMTKEEDETGFSVNIYVHGKEEAPFGKKEYIKITDGKKYTTVDLIGYGTEDWKFIVDPNLNQ